jgi:hypothetical protein
MLRAALLGQFDVSRLYVSWTELRRRLAELDARQHSRRSVRPSRSRPDVPLDI